MNRGRVRRGQPRARAKERRNYFREGTLLSLLRGEVTFKLVAICRDGVQLPSNGVRTCSRHKIPNNKRMKGGRRWSV